MSLTRKTLAKYGAKIPPAPSARAKQAQPSKPDALVETLAKESTSGKKGGDKKR